MILSLSRKGLIFLTIFILTCCNNSVYTNESKWELSTENDIGMYCRDIDLAKYGAGDYTTYEKLSLNKGGVGKYSYSDFEQSFQQDFKWTVIDSTKITIHYLGNVEKEDEEFKITYQEAIGSNGPGSDIPYTRCTK